MLRRRPDSIDDFQRNAVRSGSRLQQPPHRDLRHARIPDDIGPTGTYPAGYRGPDIITPTMCDPPVDGEAQRLDPILTAYWARWQLGASSRAVQGRSQERTVHPGDLPYSAPTGPAVVSRTGPGAAVAGRDPDGLSDLSRAGPGYAGALDQGVAPRYREGDGQSLRPRYDPMPPSRSESRRTSHSSASTQNLNSPRNRRPSRRRLARPRYRAHKAARRRLCRCPPTIIGMAYDSLPFRSVELRLRAKPPSSAGAATENSRTRQLGLEVLADQLDTDIAAAVCNYESRLRASRRLAELESWCARAWLLRLAVLMPGKRRRAVARQLRLGPGRGRAPDRRADRFRQRPPPRRQDYRYQDMAFRIFRNDALQKYRAQFDLAARYAYLAATAYDYETNLLGSAERRGPAVPDGHRPPRARADHRRRRRRRQWRRIGLADPLARLSRTSTSRKASSASTTRRPRPTSSRMRGELSGCCRRPRRHARQARDAPGRGCCGQQP